MIFRTNCIICTNHKVIKSFTKFIYFLRNSINSKSFNEFFDWNNYGCDSNLFFHLIPFEILNENGSASEVQIFLDVLL